MTASYTSDFVKELENKLRNKKLSDSSIKLYVRNLEKLNDDKVLHDFNFLKKSKDFFDKVGNYKPNTQRNFLISIVTCLDVSKNDNVLLNKLYDEYFKMLETFNKKEKGKEHELSKEQEENWISWDEVEKVHDELKSKIDLISGYLISGKEYEDLLNYLIFSLYYYQPPRRNKDFQDMEVAQKKSDINDDDINYLDLKNKQFIFNKYKTSKTYGKQIMKIDDDLWKVIKKYLIHRKRILRSVNSDSNDFLVHFNGKKLDNINSITLILNKVFGKNIGVSMLRHIYLSHVNGPKLDDLKGLKKLAGSMAHNIDTSINYIKDVKK